MSDPFLQDRKSPDITETLESLHGVSISYKEWREEVRPSETSERNEIKGAVLISHGFGERIEKYVHLAESLTESGYRVAGSDFRGMGRSSGTRFLVRSFAEYDADLSVSLKRLKRDLPGVPIFLYGHSMGALCAMHFQATSEISGLSGLILSAPLLKFGDKIPAWQIALGKLGVVFHPGFKIPTSGTGARLTSCETELSKLRSDEFRANHITLKWFFAVSKAAELVRKSKRIAELSTLWLIPGEDKVVDSHENIQFFRRLEDKGDHKMLKFDGMLHELHAEKIHLRERVFRETVNWIEERCNK